MRYNRISADCHLDLIWLPPDLFVWEAPQALKGACPTWPTARTGRAGWRRTGPPSAWPAAPGPPGRSTCRASSSAWT